MTRRARVTATVAAAVALAAAGLAGVLVVGADAHTDDECATVRAKSAELVLIADAAEQQGGLTNGAKTWISNLRNVVARAQAHCPVATTAPPSTSSASTTTSTSTTTSPSTSTTTTSTTTTSTTMPPPAGGKPNATNTGVPPGTSLTASGTITVTQAGTIVQNKLVTGCIRVQAPNVTIRNVKIAQGCYHGIDIEPWAYNATNLTITDVEVDGRGWDNCIAFYNYTATRVNLHGCADGAKVGDSTTIRDSWIHDLSNAGGCHCDAIQNTGGNGTLIDHTVLGGPAMHGDEFGPLVNITIQNSWLEGGLWGGWNQSTGARPSNMRILNNVISNIGSYSFCCVYIAPDTVWSGNTTPGGQPIPHP